LLDGISGKFISQWMEIAHEAARAIPTARPDTPTASRTRSCEQASIVLSLDNLLTFQCISERVQDGRLEVHGWYFDIDKGELLGYDPSTKEFRTLSS
jgi:carbonic anhydrase